MLTATSLMITVYHCSVFFFFSLQKSMFTRWSNIGYRDTGSSGTVQGFICLLYKVAAVDLAIQLVKGSETLSQKQAALRN